MSNGVSACVSGRAGFSIDPVLKLWLREFDAGIDILEWNPDINSKRAAQRLCELSRDILFRLGKPNEAPEPLLRQIARLFRAAVATIEAASCDEDLSAYSRNIAERAQDLKRSLIAVPA